MRGLLGKFEAFLTDVLSFLWDHGLKDIFHFGFLRKEKL